MAFDLNGYKEVLVVSHDAGAAQVVSSFVRNRLLGEPSSSRAIHYCLQGPALGIFRRKLREMNTCGIGLIKKLKPAEGIVLTGRSFVSGLEREAISLAHKNGVRVVTFLDHWDCYEEAFIGPSAGAEADNKITPFLPDEVIVGDEYAGELVKKTRIPPGIVSFAENEYFKDIKKFFQERAKGSKVSPKSMLFLCEPTGDILKSFYGSDGREWGYNEVEVLKEVLSKTGAFIKAGFEELIVRPHPSESGDKYSPLISGADTRVIRISLSKEPAIEDDIMRSELVIGMESMGLVLAILAGKRAVSYIPKGCAKSCSLPHRELKKIDDINAIERML